MMTMTSVLNIEDGDGSGGFCLESIRYDNTYTTGRVLLLHDTEDFHYSRAGLLARQGLSLSLSFLFHPPPPQKKKLRKIEP